MSTHSTIEWTESTWNPLTGCTKRSVPAASIAMRNECQSACRLWVSQTIATALNLTLHENALEKPLEWKKPQMIFVNSMSDLFHKDVPVNH